MSYRATIAVDVDEVCADMLGEWLFRYWTLTGHSLTPADIGGWDVSQYATKLSRNKLYDILREPDFYDYVGVIPGAQQGVDDLRTAGYRVVFVSACVPGTEDAKVKWLVQHGFLPADRKRLDFLAMQDKSLVRAAALFDDKVDNCLTFPGLPVLVRRPHNAVATSCIKYSVAGIHEAAALLDQVPFFL